MLIDEVKVKIRGGNGGDGIASFKNPMMTYGPTGGDGGNGGDVFVIGVTDLGALRAFRHKKSFRGENGGTGGNNKKDGANGEDLILQVPVGTVIHNLDLKEDVEITKINQKVLIAHGAHGGYGNFHFRSSTNIYPQEFTTGHKAKEFEFLFELKLIADVGLVGLPNVGKSALLNQLTAAKSRVANYHFTTLEPHLGTYYGLILADIPGLIEGASDGKGLGQKFLRHIARCQSIFHLISSESQDVEKDYRVIREELRSFDKSLIEKQEYLFLSKGDLDDVNSVKDKLKKMKNLNKNARVISIHDPKSMKEVEKILREIISKKTDQKQDRT